MVVAKIANMELGSNQHTASANLQTQSRKAAAAQLKVSERSVNTAKKVQSNGVDELQQAVESGEVSVSAAEISELSAKKQREVELF